MRAFFKQYGEVVQIVLGLLIAVSAAMDMMGKPVRLVQVIALTAGMFGAGLGAGLAIGKRRAGRGPRVDAVR
jgi:hypothetical protein